MSSKKVITSLVILIVAAGLVGGYFVYKHPKETSYSSSKSQKSTGSSSVSMPSKLNPQSTNNTSGSQNSSSAKSGPSNTTSQYLITPSGNFVSNHNPNTSDPRQLTEVSVCNTTPGAYCNIEFINGNTTLSLSNTVVGSTGSVSWSWNINTIGLYKGNWTVKAVATLNGQTKTAVDQLPLSIQ